MELLAHLQAVSITAKSPGVQAVTGSEADGVADDGGGPSGGPSGGPNAGVVGVGGINGSGVVVVGGAGAGVVVASGTPPGKYLTQPSLSHLDLGPGTLINVLPQRLS